MDLWKAARGVAHKNAGGAFFLGFFLVILTYFSVSQHSSFFAISAPNVVARPAETEAPEEKSSPETTTTSPSPVAVAPPAAVLEKKPEEKMEEEPVEMKTNVSGAAPEEEKPPPPPVCDVVEGWGSDVCDAAGDIRIQGSSSSILIAGAGAGEPREWKIRPYSRKRMAVVPEVSVRELRSPADAPACTVRSSVPAVVFATGGLIGNYWHDFSDVIIPLFLAARRFDGEVQLVVTHFQGWFVGKYLPILKKLTNYDIVDLAADAGEVVRCYPRAVVGLRMNKEFSTGPSMPAFTEFLRGVYSLPRAAPTSPAPEKKPRLMIISRRHPRKIVNLDAVVKLVETTGFEVVVGDPPFNVNVGEFAGEVNRCDAMVGVHGAGLTNSLFLPTGGALVQVVPYGNLEELCRTDFGEPAVDMGLDYVAYNCSVEESTLLETLGADHVAVKDPASVHRSGWGKVAEFYLGKQDVRINLESFAPVLRRVFDELTRRK